MMGNDELLLIGGCGDPHSHTNVVDAVSKSGNPRRHAKEELHVPPPSKKKKMGQQVDIVDNLTTLHNTRRTL
jgi:hypothetical protein